MSIIKSNNADIITSRRSMVESIDNSLVMGNPNYDLMDVFGRPLQIGDYVLHIKNNGNFISPRVGVVVGQTTKKITIHTQICTIGRNRYSATNVDWFRLIKIDSNMVKEIQDVPF